jgi:hypothetical protein
MAQCDEFNREEQEAAQNQNSSRLNEKKSENNKRE